MADVMMQLGRFQFGLDTAAYQRLSRSAEARWARQSRIGTTDQLQFVGLAPQSIEFSGTILPQWRGGYSQTGSMRGLVSLGIPLPLVSGLGSIMGLWVVETVSEEHETFDVGGAARVQSFTMRIARYDAGLGSILRLL